MVDGVVHDFFGPIQYLIFCFIFPIFKIHSSELSWTEGLFWIVIAPWFIWSALLFLFMSVVAHFRRHDTPSRLTSRRSQPPLALSVPLSRFTSRVGGGSAFFVRRF